MSRDLRNSLYLWTGTIAFFVVSWALLRSNVLPRFPPRMLWAFGVGIGVYQLCRLMLGLWQRRAPEPNRKVG